MALHLVPLEVDDFGQLPEAVPDLVRELTVDLDKRAHGKGYVDFTDERKVRFLMFLAKFGLQQKAATYAGVSYQCAKNHKRDSEEFAEAWEQALEIYRESLESAALRRALDGWEEPVYQKGELVGTIHKFSERMLELVLKANLPNKYRENVKVDASVTGGVLLIPKPMTSEEWENQFGQQAIEDQSKTLDGSFTEIPEKEK